MGLEEKNCTACHAGTPPLESSRANELLALLGGDWEFNSKGHLEKLFKFKTFNDAMAFANSIAHIAEKQRHHPDLQIGWGKCTVEIWTHGIGGLSENDFYLAAKIEKIVKKERKKHNRFTAEDCLINS